MFIGEEALFEGFDEIDAENLIGYNYTVENLIEISGKPTLTQKAKQIIYGNN